jgi:hypothetical protein
VCAAGCCPCARSSQGRRESKKERADLRAVFSYFRVKVSWRASWTGDEKIVPVHGEGSVNLKVQAVVRSVSSESSE